MADRIYVTYTPTGAPGSFHTAIHYERTGPAGDIIKHVVIEAKPAAELNIPDKALGAIEEAFRNGDGPSRFGNIDAKVRDREATDLPKEASDDPNAPYEIIAEGDDLSGHLARVQLYADGFNRAGFVYRGHHQNSNTFASGALRAGGLQPATGVGHDPAGPAGELLEFFTPGLNEPLGAPVGQRSFYERVSDGTKRDAVPPDPQTSFDNRFGKWGSVPAGNAPPATSDRPNSFDTSFGNWGSVPAGGFGDTTSPVLRALDKYRRLAAPDGPTSVAALPSPTASNASGPGFGSQIIDELSTAGKRAAPVLSRVGKFIGDSLITPAEAETPSAPQLPGAAAPNWPTYFSGSNDGSIANRNGSSALAANQGFPRLSRRTYTQSQASMFDERAPAVPLASPDGALTLMDAYLLYRKGLDANQSQASAIDAGAPAAPLVSSDDSNFSGGLFGRFAAMAGIDPRNPNQFAPPPQDDELRGFYRDDPLQPWPLQRWR